jgi:hypothetical protein
VQQKTTVIVGDEPDLSSHSPIGKHDFLNENKLNDNLNKFENDKKKLQLIKMLSTKEFLENKYIDQNFSEIIVDDFNDAFGKTILDDKNFIEKIKPYLFDALKRISRFTKIKSTILEYANKNDKDSEFYSFFNKLNERDLVCALIECVNENSKAKLAKQIAKNDYALPLAYSVYNFKKDCLELKLSFKIFDEVLCFTYRPLAIFSGTKNAVYRGKTSLIPFIFDGMSQDLSIFSSKSNYEANKNNVDIICNEETCDSWVIADFHSEVENEQAKNLLKSFGAFSTLHVINVTFDDFNELGEPQSELKEMLEWYKGFYSSNKKSPHVILLFRDYLTFILPK